MDQPLRILLIEDRPLDAELLKYELRRSGLQFSLKRVVTRESFQLALKEFQPQVIVSDNNMPHFDGLAALAVAKEAAPDIPFIFLSGTGNKNSKTDALLQGAADHVLKGGPESIVIAITRALKRAEERG